MHFIFYILKMLFFYGSPSTSLPPSQCQVIQNTFSKDVLWTVKGTSAADHSLHKSWGLAHSPVPHLCVPGWGCGTGVSLCASAITIYSAVTQWVEHLFFSQKIAAFSSNVHEIPKNKNLQHVLCPQKHIALEIADKTQFWCRCLITSFGICPVVLVISAHHWRILFLILFLFIY